MSKTMSALLLGLIFGFIIGCSAAFKMWFYTGLGSFAVLLIYVGLIYEQWKIKRKVIKQ